MGRPYEGKSPKISQLLPHHKSMARAMVMRGLTPSQLAEEFGFSPGQITRIIHSPMFEAEVARFESEADEVAVDGLKEINKMVGRATEVLDEDMNTPGTSKKLRQAAAKDVLNRAGVGVKDNDGKTRPNVSLTQINVINEATPEELRDEVIELLEEE